MSRSELRIVLVSIGADDADAFVRTLCEERLVACGNILPQVRSHYWWNGVLEQDAEALVVMETVAERLEAAMTRAAQLHPYDVPKIIALSPEAVHEPYLAWAREQTG